MVWVALKNGIRPERPMAAASVASQLGITASPISAAVVYYLSQLTGIAEGLSLMSILAVTVPATLIGTIGMSLYSMRRGVELQDDPEYQRRLQDPDWSEKIKNTTATTLGEQLPTSARNSVLRITSYNVCYTKLLRVHAPRSAPRPQVAAWPRAAPG